MTDETKDTGNTCPECGESLEGRDPKAHAARHWRGTGDAAPREGTEAYKRQQQLIGEEK
jgi:hypothetical protein